jgi:hypothetical protein
MKAIVVLIAGILAIPLSDVAADPVKEWRIAKDVSPIDDSESFEMSIAAEADAGIPRAIAWPMLTLRCERKSVEALIVLYAFVGSGSTLVTTRFDKDKAVVANWNVSSNHQAIFNQSPKRFIELVGKRSKLLVQMVPHSQNSVMFSFNLAGAEAGIAQLKSACKWK